MAKLRVMAEGLNVREQPSSIAKILGALRRDDVVHLLEYSTDGLWYRVQQEDALIGWARGKYLAPVEEPGAPPAEEFPWMALAFAEIGVREYAGAADNPRILEYLHSTSLGDVEASRDSTAWCSAFVNWCVERAGYAGTDSARARDWAHWGQALVAPRRGCIAVFRRPCSSKDKKKSCGHVAFFIDEIGNGVRVLGGNQGDQVCIASYPRDDVLSYRIPL